MSNEVSIGQMLRLQRETNRLLGLAPNGQFEVWLALTGTREICIMERVRGVMHTVYTLDLAPDDLRGTQARVAHRLANLVRDEVERRLADHLGETLG